MSPEQNGGLTPGQIKQLFTDLELLQAGLNAQAKAIATAQATLETVQLTVNQIQKVLTGPAGIVVTHGPPTQSK